MSENKPKALELKDNIFQLDVHPNRDILVTGMVNGRVQCYQYGTEEHQNLWTSKTFKKSCRDVSFTVDGSNIMAISRDRSIQTIDTETGKTISSRETTHDCPLNSLLIIDNNMSSTGDDQGIIKMTYSKGKRTLVAVGGDGYLSTWDIRKPNVVAMSDQIEDELLSIALMKNDKKAVVGTQEGILSLWTWGDWGDYKDRIVGHPNSIDAICKLDEDTICTGSSDGIIR
ncbi:WD40-repeat-containing domain protein [Sporodiniella umbellata]|nr:WD40-repeat-containing domain protein [Sporodiniella umbellata]